MYREGLDWFAAQMQAAAGRDATYARGELTCDLVAVRDRTQIAGLTDLGDPQGQYHDELIVADELLLGGLHAAPAAGDTITLTEEGTEKTYTVRPTEKDGFVYEEIAGGKMFRVHVKH
ncbi:MAG: hypothetical protein PHU85_00185 [Phycisphaerae bacterium]|nr:hypothetical protein [Phycisphaerae bacterium]